MPDAPPASQPDVPHKPANAASSVAATDGGELAPSTVGDTPAGSPPPELADEAPNVSAAPMGVQVMEDGDVVVVGARAGEAAADVAPGAVPAPAGVPSQLRLPPVLPPRTPAQMERIQALLQKDAFLVFRALCKLSIKTADANTSDLTVLRGKVCTLCGAGIHHHELHSHPHAHKNIHTNSHRHRSWHSSCSRLF